MGNWMVQWETWYRTCTGSSTFEAQASIFAQDRHRFKPYCCNTPFAVVTVHTFIQWDQVVIVSLPQHSPSFRPLPKHAQGSLTFNDQVRHTKGSACTIQISLPGYVCSDHLTLTVPIDTFHPRHGLDCDQGQNQSSFPSRKVPSGTDT